MSSPGNPLMPPTEVTITDVTQSEVDPRQKSKLESLGRKDAGEHNTHWAARAAHMTDGPGQVLSIVTGFIDVIMALELKLLTAAQGEQNSSFYDLAAAALHDLTGVEVDAEQLKQSTFGSGRLAGMETLGGDLFDLLQSEFEPPSGDLEEGSDSAAKKFMGFLLNFAIRQGNVETILSLIPEEYRIGDGARNYGKLMARNLGLGRLARRALQPLIQILVSDPLMYKLQEDYRPKRIGASPAIRKFFRDSTFEPQMRKELGQEGYTDARIDDLITEMRPLISERELVHYLFRYGDTTVTVGGSTTLGVRDMLAQRGFTSDSIEKYIQASRPILDKAEIATLFTNGVIDHELASSYMSKLGYDADTTELVLRAHSLQHHRNRQLGLSELKKAFHNAVIDLLELKAHLTAAGYSDDDVQIITLDLLQPTHGKVRQLSLAEVKAGLKAGVLTHTQAAEHLKTLGFSDADIAVLLALAPAPKPTTAPTTPTV